MLKPKLTRKKSFDVKCLKRNTLSTIFASTKAWLFSELIIEIQFLLGNFKSKGCLFCFNSYLISAIIYFAGKVPNLFVFKGNMLPNVGGICNRLQSIWFQYMSATMYNFTTCITSSETVSLLLVSHCNKLVEIRTMDTIHCWNNILHYYITKEQQIPVVIKAYA
jgi:hypothetical protein